MLGMPQAADQGDDIEAEFMLRKGEASLLLRTEGNAAAGAVGRATASDLEPEPGPCRAGSRRRVGSCRPPRAVPDSGGRCA
jgi:hypothetical protein